MMRNHPRIIGFLGQGLSHEYGAVQQYLTQASLCTLWGLKDWVVRFRADAEEELGHADLLNQRLLLLGVAPTGAQLRPPRPGTDLRQMLVLDIDVEHAAVALYAEAESFATRMRDGETAALFSRLRQDEEEHLQHLHAVLAQMDGQG